MAKKKAKKPKLPNKEIIEAIVRADGMCETLDILIRYAEGQRVLAEEEQYAAEEKQSEWDDVISSVEEAQANLGYVNDC